jgi:hypothetical protein
VLAKISSILYNAVMGEPPMILNKNILIAILEMTNYLLGRAAKADKKKFLRAMAKVADQAPEKEDVLSLVSQRYSNKTNCLQTSSSVSIP